MSKRATRIEQMIDDLSGYFPPERKVDERGRLKPRSRSAFHRMWRYYRLALGLEWVLRDGGTALFGGRKYGWVSGLEKLRELQDTLPARIWVDEDGGWSNRRPARQFEHCYQEYDASDLAQELAPKVLRGYI